MQVDELPVETKFNPKTRTTPTRMHNIFACTMIYPSIGLILLEVLLDAALVLVKDGFSELSNV